MSDGHRRADALCDPADLTALHFSIGLYAKQLWDIQQQRIAADNRVGALEREDLGHLANPIRETVAQYKVMERDIDRALVGRVREHFMADWIVDQRGIGLPGFGRLLGVTGNIDRFPTVSKLWKYLGLHVTNGHAPKMVKGESWTHTDCKFGHLQKCKPECKTDHHPNCVEGGIGTAYAPQGRVICHQLGESIVKLGHNAGCHKAAGCKTKEEREVCQCRENCIVDHGGQYRRLYVEKKAYYEAERPDWTQAHRANAAMRYAVKALVKNLWREWHIRRGHTITERPFIVDGGITVIGHICSCTEESGPMEPDTHMACAAPLTIREPVLV